MIMLAADIGGTNSRFSMFSINDGKPVYKCGVVISSREEEFSHLLNKLFTCWPVEWTELARVSHVVVAAAGPVRDGRIEMTNADFAVEQDQIQSFFPDAEVLLMNDFEAQAWACLSPAVAEAELVLPGEGKIELTGSLGDVMKESARIAVSYIRAHAKELGIAEDFYKKKDLHIHFPEGAVPKDGPSAGAAMATALASALSGVPVRRDLAMTGEIDLTGEVMAIGGLKEKTMAAAAAGVSTVLIPADNMRELSELDPDAVRVLEILPCRTLADVLGHALVTKAEKEAHAPVHFCRPSTKEQQKRGNVHA